MLDSCVNSLNARITKTPMPNCELRDCDVDRHCLAAFHSRPGSPSAHWGDPQTDRRLAAIGIFQFFEGTLVTWVPRRGPAYSVLIKIALATLLIDHTGDIGINSAYYQIYYLPIVTAAIYFGPIATISWTTLASLAYASFLIPALQEYELTAEGATTLATRLLFFYLAAILVNRFVIANKQHLERLQTLSETLEQTNMQLRRAEADARRSERLAALGPA